MGDLMPQANSASEEIGCNSCSYCPDCKDICIEREQCVSSSAEKTSQAMPIENLGITNHNVGLVVQELGITLKLIMHIHDTCESFDHNETSNDDGICQQKEMHSFTDANKLTKRIKDAKFLCSDVVQLPPLTIDVKDAFSSTVARIDNLLKAENPDYECAISLPTAVSPKLPSAMKGSRAQQGSPLKTKLSVRWSPDVYDPPVTSESHTVKGYHRQRPKAKKDQQHKHRHSRSSSKSSRGSSSSSSGDKKHSNRRSTTTGSSVDPRILRLRAYNYEKSKLEVDYAVRNQDSKFGSSSYYVESLPQVHLSVAEAS